MVLHFAAGFIVCFASGFGLSRIFVISPAYYPLFGLVCVVIFSIGSELKGMVDKLDYRRFDWLNITATIAGGAFAAIGFYLLGRL